MNYHTSMKENKNIFSTLDLATHKGCSMSYICRLIRLKKINATKVSGAWIILKKDAEKFFNDKLN